MVASLLGTAAVYEYCALILQCIQSPALMKQVTTKVMEYFKNLAFTHYQHNHAHQRHPQYQQQHFQRADPSSTYGISRFDLASIAEQVPICNYNTDQAYCKNPYFSNSSHYYSSPASSQQHPQQKSMNHTSQGHSCSIPSSYWPHITQDITTANNSMLPISLEGYQTSQSSILGPSSLDPQPVVSLSSFPNVFSTSTVESGNSPNYTSLLQSSVPPQVSLDNLNSLSSHTSLWQQQQQFTSFAHPGGHQLSNFVQQHQAQPYVSGMHSAPPSANFMGHWSNDCSTQPADSPFVSFMASNPGTTGVCMQTDIRQGINQHSPSQPVIDTRVSSIPLLSPSSQPQPPQSQTSMPSMSAQAHNLLIPNRQQTVGSHFISSQQPFYIIHQQQQYSDMPISVNMPHTYNNQAYLHHHPGREIVERLVNRTHCL
ncbi:unnamed protein product [Protopolystoma xenopodis]|uniref:Uncharacterized protein n=1 Tax=Protopolystoma xenopodis TaxID=117903 RepID=A0A448WEV7_9PLAT|nr:unnamed protein product [Protopolystoma xenopodis]